MMSSLTLTALPVVLCYYIQETSVSILQSLPGGLWEMYGASGWGPDATQHFMHYDYGSISRQIVEQENTIEGTASYTSIPRRTKQLFEGGSCEWTRYYTNEEILWNVASVYHKDYLLFGWYNINGWINKLHACH